MTDRRGAPSGREPRQPVSINPLDFTKPCVYDLPAEEVIKTLYRQESQRSREEKDFNERDIKISAWTMPEGLLHAIDSIDHETGFGKAVIVKCLSHKVKSWYEHMPVIGNITSLYRAVHKNADGYSNISATLRSGDYSFLHPVLEAKRKSPCQLRSIQFVVDYLSEMSPALGASATQLFLSGLCWAIASNQTGWAEHTVREMLEPEAFQMETHIGGREITLKYLKELTDHYKSRKECRK